jgi:hypothetical protein
MNRYSLIMGRDFSLVLASFIPCGLDIIYDTGWRGVARASFDMCDPAYLPRGVRPVSS